MRATRLLWIGVAFTLCAFRFGTVELGRKAGQKLDDKIMEQAAAAAPVAKGNRILAMDVKAPQNNDFNTVFNAARNAGIQSVALTVFWDELETAPSTFNPTNNLSVANSYYPAFNTPVLLTIPVLDTTRRRVPADLSAVDFDNPVMIARFKALLDWAFTQIPNLELTTLSIGNEIDSVLGSNNAEWQKYETFFAAVSEYARTKRANLIVGVKTTFAGMTINSTSRVQSINAHADAAFVTYYPLNADFTVKSPNVVSTDFGTVVSLYPNKPIYFHEAGYPSSSATNSSEALQARFVEEIFKAWDIYRMNVALINFNWSTDLSPAALNALEMEFGISDPAFLGYLGSIGFRTYSGGGTNKPAFDTLANEAHRRGW